MTTDSIMQLLSEGNTVKIVYKSGDGEITERRIVVKRVVRSEKYGAAIFAHCERRGEDRTFCASRILAAMPDDGRTVASFAMIAAVTAGDTEAYSAAHAAMVAA